MFCPSCGQPVDLTHRFCFRCGGSLEALHRAEPAASTPAPPPPSTTPVTPTADEAVPPLQPAPPSSDRPQAGSPPGGVPSLAARLASLPPLERLPEIEPLPPLPPLAEVRLVNIDEFVAEARAEAPVERPVAEPQSPVPLAGTRSATEPQSPAPLAEMRPVVPRPVVGPPPVDLSGPITVPTPQQPVLAPLIPPLPDAGAPITGQVPITARVPSTDRLPVTSPLESLVITPVDETPLRATEPVTTPTIVVAPREVPAVADEGFRITAQLVLAALAAVVAVAAAFVDFASFEVTGTDRVSAAVRFGDLSSSNIISLAIGVTLLFAGAIAGAAGQRPGTGLAGGAGLALAGVLAGSVGLGVSWLDTAEVSYLPTPGNVITVTRDIGFFLAIGAAALAGLSFAVSFGAARGRRRSYAVVIVVGIAAAIAGAVGPLLPVSGADWADNLSQASIPDATLFVRLGVLVLFVVGCVVGFAISGRFGGAMVLGAAAIAVQQTVMAYVELGTRPLGFGFGNPKGGGGFEFVPHPWTLAALGAVVLLALLTIALPLRDDD